MKLNLGSSFTKIDGFINVDLRKFDNVDIVADISKLDFAEDNSIEEIYCSHVLEHFHHTETDRVLKEWYRVLKPGGKIYIGVPDMEVLAALIQMYGLNKWIESVIYGTQDYPHSEHLAAFSFAKLGSDLTRAGFTDIVRVNIFPLNVMDATTIGVTLNLTSTGIKISLNVMARKGVQNGSV